MNEHFYSSIANFVCKFHVTDSLFMPAVVVQNWTYIIIIIFMTVVSEMRKNYMDAGDGVPKCDIQQHKGIP